MTGSTVFLTGVWRREVVTCDCPRCSIPTASRYCDGGGSEGRIHCSFCGFQSDGSGNAIYRPYALGRAWSAAGFKMEEFSSAEGIETWILSLHGQDVERAFVALPGQDGLWYRVFVIGDIWDGGPLSSAESVIPL